MGEDYQNPNTLRAFSSTKIRFLKSSSKQGGSRPFGKNPNVSRFFYFFSSDKAMKLTGGGSVINGAYPI